MTDGPVRLTAADYERIEDRLLADPETRAFLRLRDRRNRAVALEEVRRLFREHRKPAESDPASHIRILRRELQELSSHIAQTRREIAALKPDDPSADRIMLATEELDAILQATEHATTEILNGAERIQTVAEGLRAAAPEAARQLDDEVMHIMTACSFQDITGQRMTKVVNTLRYIERRVEAMIGIWGELGLDAGESPADEADRDRRPDAHLLNGPQLRGGVDQAAVDALFDAPASGPLGQDAIDDMFP